MRFDDHVGHAREPCRERLVILIGDGTRIEKAAGVVQLHVIDGVAIPAYGLERVIQLVDERAGGRVLLDRVLPEVAHHATPRALAAGQEDGRHLGDPAVGGPLRLDQDALVCPGVERDARRPVGEHEPIACRTRCVNTRYARHQAYSARNRSR